MTQELMGPRFFFKGRGAKSNLGIEQKDIFLSYRCGGLAILWLLWPPRTLGTKLQAEKVKQVSTIMMVVVVVVVMMNFEIILLIRREFWAARDDWEQMMKQPYMIDYIRVYQWKMHDHMIEYIEKG